jgi:hypothetical protein
MIGDDYSGSTGADREFSVDVGAAPDLTGEPFLGVVRPDVSEGIHRLIQRTVRRPSDRRRAPPRRCFGQVPPDAVMNQTSAPDREPREFLRAHISI